MNFFIRKVSSMQNTPAITIMNKEQNIQVNDTTKTLYILQNAVKKFLR